MTNKVLITYPSKRQFNLVYRTCPSSTSYNEVTFGGELTTIIQSSNSPRINRKLQLKQNALNYLRVKQLPAPYQVNWSGVGDCPTSGTTYCNSYLTVDPSFSVINPGLPSVDDDQSYRTAVQRWYDEIGEVKLNMAQVFAERQQTIDLIATTAHRLIDAYRDIRKGRNPFGGRKPTSKKSADAWLEYTYGWVPLIQDVHDAIELRDLRPPSLIVKKRGRVTLNSTREGVPKSSQTLDSFSSMSTETRSKQLSTTVRGRITVSNTALSFANKAGLTNPALLAWELLPYSFVVDWFYPVGPWLERQTALSGISVTDASVTRTAKFYGKARVTTYVKDGLSASITGGGRGMNDKIEVQKTRTLGVPRVPPPRLKSPISISHALSALALLRQVFH